MQTLLQDIRYSLRQLVKSPGFTITAVLSLALGIGATTAVFSVIYAILENPYPYAAPDRMIHMRLIDDTGRLRGTGFTGTQLQELRKSPVVEDAFAEDDWSLTVTGNDVPEDAQGIYLTSNAFNFLGVPAAYGRGLIPSDAVDGQDPQPVAVLGYKFWQRHYGSDPSIVGKKIQLVRKDYTVVGVAGSRFAWGDADVYVPLKVTADPVRNYYVGIRLKPGVTHAQANAALDPLIQQFAKETPLNFPRGHFKLHVRGLNEDFLEQLGGTLALLFSAVLLLLAIGCGNVSILLLARGTARQQEFAVRAALGASRSRMVRQLLTESLLLSVTGAALGVLIAYKAVTGIVALLPQYSFPHEAVIGVNLPVLIFSVGVALFTGVFFGMVPALQLSRPELAQVMQASSRKIAGVRGRTMNSALIAAQIALTLVMLAGAGAAMEGFIKMSHAPLGYDPHNVMSVGIPIHDGAFPTWAERAQYFQALRDKVATVPGVTMAAISSNATPPSNGREMPMEILGRAKKDAQTVRVNLVGPGYFPLLRIPLVQGRIWDETENRNAAKVAVINQTLARQYFPNGDALGHSIKVPDTKPQAPFVLTADGADGYHEIVGIVADKRNDGMSKPILPEIFTPYTSLMFMSTQVLVRSDVPPLSLLHVIQQQVSSLNSEQQTQGDVQDLEHWITTQREYQQGEMVTLLFGAFALLALALAAVGLYSVVSYTVAQRTNEFGIRMALGASRSHVLRIVFTSMGMSVCIGIGVGLVLAVSLNKVLAQWSAGSARDPLVLLAVTLILGAAGLLACAIPARKASHVDPMQALRYE
jgi:putative ABC transport system permease protein